MCRWTWRSYTSALNVLIGGEVPVSEAARRFDIPVMTAVAVACLPIFFTGHLISRWEGGLFVGYYAAYTTYLVLAATGHAAVAGFRTAMLWFALPLTALTLGYSWRAKGPRNDPEPLCYPPYPRASASRHRS